MNAKEKQMADQNQTKMQQANKSQQQSAQQSAAQGQDWETRVATATEKVAEAEIDAEQAIEDSQNA